MSLRCFVFSSDEGTTALLRQILSGLGVEGEFCSSAVTAAEQITNQHFQIVIIDWDQQPEAGLLLNTARERKAAERPLTLTIVSKDADAPQALHAGANSLLRKPLVLNQARETLTTARDLLRSKQSSAAASAAPVFPVVPDATSEATLRAGEFLQTPTLAPGGLIETETTLPPTLGEAAQPIAPLKELEPMASSVAESQEPSPATPLSPPGNRGLDWYLKNRTAGQSAASSAAAPAPAPIPSGPPNPVRGNPELLGYEQTSSYAAAPVPPKRSELPTLRPLPKPDPALHEQKREQKKEAELFAYIQGEKRQTSEISGSGFSLAKRAIVPAVVLAAIAIVAAPQAPWHGRLQGLWRNGQQALHTWLNPQPATPTQAPAAHENFTRAGDEYKLPVAEAIPDATTDPSQIQVVPVVDPTIKKTNPQGGNVMDPSAVPADGSAQAPEPSADTPVVPNADPATGPHNSDPFRAPTDHVPAAAQPPVLVIEGPPASHADAVAGPGRVPAPAKPLPVQPAQPRVVTPTGTIPPSLKSQIAPANGAIGGNKPMDAAAPAIEPVEVSEAVERALIVESPAPVYPTTAKGQQGTVVLQVLIARDGSVQDAKFMQGSLVFARNAIDAVKQWKFRTYLLNGRPVSVQTQMTVRFKPAQ